MSVEGGPSFNPELLAKWRTLEGAELEEFARGLGDFIDGLAARLEDPDLETEERIDTEDQLAELRDSYEAIKGKLGPVRMKTE